MTRRFLPLAVAALLLGAGLGIGMRLGETLAPSAPAIAARRRGQRRRRAIPDSARLRRKLAAAEVGSTLRITVVRDGRQREFKVKVEEAPR